MSRLPPQPAEQIDRNKPVKFTFDGKSIAALEGDTIGSALYAAGRGSLDETAVAGKGGFSAEGVARIAAVLGGFAPGIWAYSINHVFTRAFYARPVFVAHILNLQKLAFMPRVFADEQKALS